MFPDNDPAQDIRANGASQQKTALPDHNASFTASAETDVLTVSASIYAAVETGSEVTLETDNTLPSPLATGTSYYVIKTAMANEIKLASSAANAIASTAIDITSSGTGVHTLTAWTPLFKVSGLPIVAPFEAIDAELTVWCSHIGRGAGRRKASFVVMRGGDTVYRVLPNLDADEAAFGDNGAGLNFEVRDLRGLATPEPDGVVLSAAADFTINFDVGLDVNAKITTEGKCTIIRL